MRHERHPRGGGFTRGLAFSLAASVLSGGCRAGEPSFPLSAEELALSSLKLTVSGEKLLDARGREVLLRGVNAGGRSKLAPFFPFAFRESGLASQAKAPPFDEAARAYLDRVKAWGVNVLRVPFSWEAVEPERGRYDELFLARFRRLCELCGERGLRVIVDFHQDAFARPYCGDGFPLWACTQPVPETPADCSEWFSAYLDQSSPASRAFDRFWADEDGLHEAFRQMWRRVARALWPVASVVGFEVMNEPHAGSATRPGWDEQVLRPFYEATARAIREEAPGAPVFFDPPGLDGATVSTQLRPPAGAGFVFAPHYYSVGAFIPGLTTSPAKILADLGRWAAQGATWKLPVFVGEFGIAPTADKAASYMRAHYDAFDAHALHGAQWEYSTTEDRWNAEAMSVTGPGGVETALVAELARPFPRAVAGTLVRFTYDATARRAELVYDARAEGITELALPARTYPTGADLTLSGVDGAAFRIDGGAVFVYAPTAGRLTVSLRPAAR
ncbi:MAG: cellulase family glycosylhydrolase [Deltaproteobacteria bacterium]|nr:cellulase family glycosylhydrolase [Deltaproteobacteria bacterium]